MGINGETSILLDFEKDDKIRFDGVSLGLSAFFATLFLYAPNLSPFKALPQTSALISYLVLALMGATVCTSLIFLIVTLKRLLEGTRSKKMFLTGAILHVLGTTLAVTSFLLPQALPLLAVASGLCIGVGLVPLCIAWGCYFSTWGLRNALFHCAVAFGVANGINWLFVYLPQTPLLILFFALLGIGTALPTVMVMRGTLSTPEKDAAALADNASNYSITLSLRKMGSVILLPLIGLLVFAFLMGTRKFLLFDLFDVEILSAIAASACVIVLCFFRLRKVGGSLIYQVLIPCIASFVIVLGSFPVGTAPQFYGAVFTYVFFALIALIAIASLVAVSNAGEFSPLLIFGTTVFLYAIASLLGIAFSYATSSLDDAGPILLVLTTIYFVVLITASSIDSWRRVSALTNDIATTGTKQENSIKETLQRKCQSLAQRYGLSKRESEIICYMGRGHNPVYIAKTLFISESTARSHVRNIYGKVGISSREELLQLIDDETVGDGETLVDD